MLKIPKSILAIFFFNLGSIWDTQVFTAQCETRIKNMTTTEAVIEGEDQTPKFVQYNSELGKKILYEPSKRVEKIQDNAELTNLIATMKRAMTGIGIGLAANQIGTPLQVFMIEFVTDKEDPAHTSRYELNMPDVPYEVFINPKITKASQEKIAFWHGCLSAMDNPRGLVATYKWIEYEAYDEYGNLKKGRLDDMGAVIFQHEFRHLLGSCYLDHAKKFLSPEEMKELLNQNKISLYQNADDTVPLLLSDYKIGESIEEFAERTLLIYAALNAKSNTGPTSVRK